MNLYKYDNLKFLPSKQMPLHRQDTWEITYMLLGKGTRTMGNTEQRFTDGDLVLIPPHIPHQWRFDDSHTDATGHTSSLTLTFSTELLDRWAGAFPEYTARLENFKATSRVMSFGKADTAVITDLMRKMHKQNQCDLLPYVMRLILIMEKSMHSAYAVGNTPETDRTAERLNMVRVYTACNYSRTITIDMIAGHVGMNRSSFCTFFRKATGQTYITYLNKFRIDKACTLLRKNAKDVDEVCYMVGFNDVPYFSRCFRNNRGMSPREYAEGIITKRQIVTNRDVTTNNHKR